MQLYLQKALADATRATVRRRALAPRGEPPYPPPRRHRGRFGGAATRLIARPPGASTARPRDGQSDPLVGSRRTSVRRGSIMSPSCTWRTSPAGSRSPQSAATEPLQVCVRVEGFARNCRNRPLMRVRLLLLACHGRAARAGLGERRAVVGIADQKADMFSDPLFASLGVKHARIAVSWDALNRDWQRQRLDRLDGRRAAPRRRAARRLLPLAGLAPPRRCRRRSA